MQWVTNKYTQCISFTITTVYNAEKDYGSNAATGSTTGNYSNPAATTWQKKPICYFTIILMKTASNKQAKLWLFAELRFRVEFWIRNRVEFWVWIQDEF